MLLKPLHTFDEIAQAFEVFIELRPYLTDVQSFITKVENQRKEGYEIIAAIKDNTIAACIGFRIMHMLAHGKILYIDDLITKEKFRKNGYGKMLLDHVVMIAKTNNCCQVHLDSGYTRHAAHRLYLKEGFELHAHHLKLQI